MLLLNFSHPLTPNQLASIQSLTGRAVERVVDVKTHFDQGSPFVEQAQGLVNSVEVSAAEWQTMPVLVNPPSLSVIACILLAELHGRMGYFPPVLRLRPVPGSMPTAFEVAEIVNLQAVRDAARALR
ncbi:MAG TPA: CRISPR-associated protein Csx15 [Gemmataceae bacterium]|nr:CRISPR-associated protein Csx15 [Gemmataceae bacterium]